jgi:hypothetical protein
MTGNLTSLPSSFLENKVAYEINVEFTVYQTKSCQPTHLSTLPSTAGDFLASACPKILNDRIKKQNEITGTKG